MYGRLAVFGILLSTVATYKLIQDIEAEDKVLGPLTLRQFVFAMIAAFLIYACVFVILKHLLVLLALTLPPALFFTFFALPFGRDQPTEVWALAKLRFWFKPRRRVWNQSGVKELVTITVPKKVERVYTNGLSQTEVQSRLKALAQTIDSRGWAIKHVDTEALAEPAGVDSERLINIANLPQEVPADDALSASADMLDAANNPIAKQFEVMIDESSRARRQQLIERMNDVTPPQPAAATASAPIPDEPDVKWFVQSEPSAVAPPTAAETDLAASLAARANSRQVSFGNLRTIRPLAAPAGPVTDDGQTTAGNNQPVPAPTAQPQPPMTANRDPAIISLAKNNDLSLATLARQAKKDRGGNSPTEIVIPLH